MITYLYSFRLPAAIPACDNLIANPLCAERYAHRKITTVKLGSAYVIITT